MPNPVPTKYDPAALAARVAALKNGTLPVTPPVSTKGIQARRVHDVFSGFGITVFLNTQDGATPAQASADSHATALNLLYGGCGFGPVIRIYCEQYPVQQTINWCRRLGSLVHGVTFCLTFTPAPAATSAIAIMASASSWRGRTRATIRRLLARWRRLRPPLWLRSKRSGPPPIRSGSWSFRRR